MNDTSIIIFRIMVLDDGRLVEMDTPAHLLEETSGGNKPGMFASLWKRHQHSRSGEQRQSNEESKH
jgi:ABC-type multidrug transport system fused ATPase/permease subunit